MMKMPHLEYTHQGTFVGSGAEDDPRCQPASMQTPQVQGNEHPNELMGRFSLEAPSTRVPAPGDWSLAGLCNEDLLCRGQIHARAAKVEIMQVCSQLSLLSLVGNSLLCSNGSPIQSLNSLHTGSTLGTSGPRLLFRCWQQRESMHFLLSHFLCRLRYICRVNLPS